MERRDLCRTPAVSSPPFHRKALAIPQIRKSMFEDLVKEAEEIARAETVRLSTSGKPQLAERAA
jgi:hypothetical protein